MANLTQPTASDVETFLASVPNERRRTDGLALAQMMARITGAPAKMWGPTMVGFGDHHYRYASGREGDTFVVGFSPRAPALTIYGIYSEYDGTPLPAEFGPHATGKSCVYVKDLTLIDESVLATLIAEAWAKRDEST